jgi:dolichol-phosphate mannosyltransferase
MNPRFSIILPVYNQADHLEGVVRALVMELEGLPGAFELILVPNGCRDHSEEVCCSLAEESDRIVTAPLSEGGWGRAVRHGVGRARGEILCFTNLARTQPHDLFLALLYAHSHPDAVIKASRKVRDSFVRRLGSLLYNLQCRALFDLPYWDINGTPKVFPRSFSSLLNLREEGDLLDLEFMVECRNAPYRVIELPILATVRHGGKSTTRLRSALRMYQGAFRLWLERRQRV